MPLCPLLGHKGHESATSVDNIYRCIQWHITHTTQIWHRKLYY